MGLTNLLRQYHVHLMPTASPDQSPVPLHPSDPVVIELHRLTKGIDNLHIDVALSPAFRDLTDRLITTVITQEIETGIGGAKRSGRAFQPWDEFHLAYTALVESALHRAKGREGLPLVQAAQFAALKWVWDGIHARLDDARQDLRRQVASRHGQGEHRLIELNEQLSWLTRARPKLAGRILRQFLQAILKAEDGPLADLRHSLLGVRWSLPRALLANPLLSADQPFDEDLLLTHYVFIRPGQPHDTPQTYSYPVIEQLLATLFPSSAGAHWIDQPDNIALLFEEDLAAEQLARATQSHDQPGRAMWLAHRRFQRRLLAAVERPLRRTGLLRHIAAAYETAALAKSFAEVCPPGELHHFLLGAPGRKPLPPKLKDLGTHARRRLNRLSHRQERALLVKFLTDLLTFRRDLSLSHTLREALGHLIFRHDPDDARLSRANRTLYEFGGAEESPAADPTILRHAILKADIRGSTTVVEQMRHRGLNPASHFSLHFFEPLNQILRDYGGDKVFLEGDAVILGMAEHEGTVEHQYSVARLCGIAMRLLELMQSHNAACRANSLPELELGIGITYCPDPPALLFDGNTPILISPAIGKADRLSSCSWALRTILPATLSSWRNVERYDLPDHDPLRGDKGDGCLRYNVNGVELDTEGFAKLRTEVPLQELTLLVPGDASPTTLFFGRYPDLNGTIQPLLIRRGQIRQFDRQHPQLGAPTTAFFYELVVQKQIHALVAEALTLRKQPSAAPRPSHAA